MSSKDSSIRANLARVWQNELTDDQTILFARELAGVFAARAGNKGREFLSLVDSGDWGSVLDYNPLLVAVDAEEYAALAQAQACFSKLVCLPNGVDRTAVAYKKFLDGEYRCGIFNRLFAKRQDGTFKFSTATECILHTSSWKIAEMLGDAPEIWDVPMRYSVGGATTTIKKKDSDLRNLIAGSLHCSEEMEADLTRMEGLLTTLPRLVEHFQDAEGMVYLQVVTGVLNFVLKNAKTDRGVTNEPDMNKLVQLSYGDVIRSRIKRKGIDLQDSERQCELARIGSITGGIATLDLSNASGLISNGLVNDQFPGSWLDILYWARTGEIFIPLTGETRSLQSYGGMGNGLVFPIESVLFHCLAEACCEYEGIKHPLVSVYGDDIIVSQGGAARVKAVFEEIGLKINEEKSFVNGPFRESCGSDWYLGVDVRPIFVRHNVSLEHLYSLHNQFFAKGDEAVCEFIVKRIPVELRLYGPPEVGDGHLWTERWKDLTTTTCVHPGSFTYSTVGAEPNIRYVVTPEDWLVPLVSIHSADKAIMLDDSGRMYRKLLGTSWELPSGFRVATKKQERECVAKRELKLLRSFAKNFEAGTEYRHQTAKQRRRRNWSVRYERTNRPDPEITVFGTPLPGRLRITEMTSYIFG